ncbi:hypothetical protein C173_06391 [Paenibacillus sp. FSL R7-277]|uniref:hypothetical protein n=1 Tax=Paenibacillus sp. FSL R7-277 TaxID=1227352 RepID=UPI0003E20FB3|nr:hypothetical protein [Paenibacillus sp. FSL R7-277]ETT76623.1 hypothetical protein C173_06391 [Paenibacillus sp. FSL R7-277]
MIDDVVRKKVVQILNDMLNGKTNIIVGCHELDTLWIQGHDFIGIDFGDHYTNLSHIPLPAQYKLWNKDALRERLNELEAYKANVLYTAKLLLEELNEIDDNYD